MYINPLWSSTFINHGNYFASTINGGFNPRSWNCHLRTEKSKSFVLKPVKSQDFMGDQCATGNIQLICHTKKLFHPENPPFLRKRHIFRTHGGVDKQFLSWGSKIFQVKKSIYSHLPREYAPSPFKFKEKNTWLLHPTQQNSQHTTDLCSCLVFGPSRMGRFDSSMAIPRRKYLTWIHQSWRTLEPPSRRQSSRRTDATYDYLVCG